MRQVPFAGVLHHIEALSSRQRIAAPDATILVAIDGRGGSGKTTLASKLQQALPRCSIVHLDDFASRTADRQRLLKQVIVPLQHHTPAKYQRFDWKEKRLADWLEIQPGGIVVVEGVSTLHDDLYQYFDVKVWIECPPEVGLARGLQRDRLVHGVDTEKDWIQTWMPEEDAYIESQRPRERADFIIDALDA